MDVASVLTLKYRQVIYHSLTDTAELTKGRNQMKESEMFVVPHVINWHNKQQFASFSLRKMRHSIWSYFIHFNARTIPKEDIKHHWWLNTFNKGCWYSLVRSKTIWQIFRLESHILWGKTFQSHNCRDHRSWIRGICGCSFPACLWVRIEEHFGDFPLIPSLCYKSKW